MGIHGVGTGYPAWGATGKGSKRSSGTGFADRMAVAGQAGRFSF